MFVFVIACENSPTESEKINPPILTPIEFSIYETAYFGDLPNGNKIELKYLGYICETNGAASFSSVMFETKFGITTWHLTAGRIEIKFGDGYKVVFDYWVDIKNSKIGLVINKICKLT